MKNTYFWKPEIMKFLFEKIGYSHIDKRNQDFNID